MRHDFEFTSECVPKQSFQKPPLWTGSTVWVLPAKPSMAEEHDAGMAIILN